MFTHIHSSLPLSVVIMALLVTPLHQSAAQPSTTITLHDLHRGTSLTVGTMLPSPHELNAFLSCRVDHAYTLMDPRLIQLAVTVARHYRQQRVDIVSAFRTKQRNTAMHQAGHQVALRSRHTHGQALDFRIPGVPISDLCAFLRQNSSGGVGCYSSLGFVHIDVGPQRWW